MGGKSKQQTSQTTTTQLPQNQQTNVDTLMRGALDYYNSGGRMYYPGETVAGFNPYQLEGQASLLDFARGSGQDYANAALRGNQFFMDPNNIMNPDRIPGYRGAQDATSRAYTENLLENVLPSVRGGATSSGQFGGSASGIGQALATDRSMTGLADALTSMDLNAYGMGLDSFNQAQNRAPSLFALGAQPGSVVAGIGDATQQQTQREIDADVARHMFGENEQMNILSLLQSLTGSAGQYGGTVQSDGTTTQSGGSPLNQALGLGMMAAGLATGNPALAMGGASGGGGKGNAGNDVIKSGGGSSSMAYMGR